MLLIAPITVDVSYIPAKALVGQQLQLHVPMKKLTTVSAAISTAVIAGSFFCAPFGKNVSYKKTTKNRISNPISCFIAKNCE
jgi:hypothetical protein